MTRERRVCKNLLLVGSNHYALSADHSIPNNTLSEQTILAEKSAWQVANGNRVVFDANAGASRTKGDRKPDALQGRVQRT